MNNKKLSRDLMWFADLHEAMGPENFGGRKNHRSVELSLNNRLVNDLLRCKRMAAIIASTDAKGCFDRIVHAIAFLCLRRLGMSSAPITSMIKAIQPLTHYIRTAFGDSDASYGFDPNDPDGIPYMGLLQGNGAAGTGCNSMLDVIIQMMRSAGFGLTMWDAICKEAIKLVCFNFVDDATLYKGGANNYTTGEEVY